MVPLFAPVRVPGNSDSVERTYNSNIGGGGLRC
jgi:hypothetical protein